VKELSRGAIGVSLGERIRRARAEQQLVGDGPLLFVQNGLSREIEIHRFPIGPRIAAREKSLARTVAHGVDRIVSIGRRVARRESRKT
jgi:hypothetical protein